MHGKPTKIQMYIFWNICNDRLYYMMLRVHASSTKSTSTEKRSNYNSSKAISEEGVVIELHGLRRGTQVTDKIQ
jgi:hypothetical protein